MPEIKWMALRKCEAYSYTLGKNHELYLLKEEDGWAVWRGRWVDGNPKPISEKTYGTRLTYEAALKQANGFIAWWEKRRNKE